MALVLWIQHKKVTCSYIFFKFAICSIALLSLGEPCHLKVRDMVMVWRTVLLLSCYDCDSTHQHYDVMQFEYVLWRRIMHEWVMNIHYQTWIAQGRFINIIHTPSKQWGVCDKTLDQVMACPMLSTRPFFETILLIRSLETICREIWSIKKISF